MKTDKKHEEKREEFNRLCEEDFRYGAAHTRGKEGKMKILLTLRANGQCRIGNYCVRHYATKMIYGEDEIINSVTIDIPEAYECEGGIGYIDRDGVTGPIQDHPAIIRGLASLKN